MSKKKMMINGKKTAQQIMELEECDRNVRRKIKEERANSKRKNKYFVKNESEDDDKYRYAFVGYELHNTLTENGSVARGVCVVDDDSNLITINERTRIEKHGEDAEYTEDDGNTWTKLPKESYVSMNMWGFTPEYFNYSEEAFCNFLNLYINEPKKEFYIPTVVNDLIVAGKVTCQVLDTPSHWFGVTYAEDRPQVLLRLNELIHNGVYPEKLF